MQRSVVQRRCSYYTAKRVDSVGYASWSDPASPAMVERGGSIESQRAMLAFAEALDWVPGRIWAEGRMARKTSKVMRRQ